MYKLCPEHLLICFVRVCNVGRFERKKRPQHFIDCMKIVFLGEVCYFEGSTEHFLRLRTPNGTSISNQELIKTK